MDYYENQTYYDVLGVEVDASFESIEKAKNRLKFGDSEDRAPFSAWNKIDEAYKILSDPQKREEYDNGLNKDNKKKSQNSGFDDIFSNSSTNTDDPKKIVVSEVLPKIKKVGKNVVLAVPTAVLATITIIKEFDKNIDYHLLKENKEKEIKEPLTEESRLEMIYRTQLDQQINKTMSEYHYNYNLEIDKVRLENRIELLKEKIKQKENQVVKKSSLLKYKLELTSLRNQLAAFYKSLEKVEEKLAEKNNEKKKQGLTKINDNIISIDVKINEISESKEKRILALKSLEAKKSSLKKLRNWKIQRQVKHREIVAIFKEGFVSSYARTENFVENLFVPIDKIDEKNKSR